jgi:hypothetical protein
MHGSVDGLVGCWSLALVARLIKWVSVSSAHRLEPEFTICRPKYNSNHHYMYLNLKVSGSP